MSATLQDPKFTVKLDGRELKIGPADMARYSPMGLLYYHNQGRLGVPRHLAYIDTKFMDMMAGEYDMLIVLMAPAHGKALWVGTPIATPEGWKSIGDLQVGDKVFGADGKPCRVIVKSPVRKDRPVWSVRTDDGHEVLADADHLWKARLSEKRPRYLLHTTAQLARQRCKRPKVRVQKPLELPDAALPVPPYVLGLWLGDGNTNEPTITASDRDIDWLRASVESCGIETSTRKRNPERSPVFGLLGVRREFVSLTLLGHKHIPQSYLRASIPQRRCLLQGLIDSDGDVQPEGQVTFSNTNRELADGVRELVLSLGRKASLIEGRAILNGKDYGPHYRVSFYMAGAASLPRKAERCRDARRTPDRYLTVEPAGTADTVCIAVDNEDHMFLCGRGMLATHNTWYSSRYVPAWYLGRHVHDTVLLISYASDFASELGENARNVLQDCGSSIFGVRVEGRRSAGSNWWLAHRQGHMYSEGVEGQTTGKRANLIICDDLYKDAEAAFSEVYRQQLISFMQHVLLPRLLPGGKLIMVNYRWNLRDIQAWLIEKAAEAGLRVKVVKLPAVAEESDELNRKPGEALWPEMYPLKWLEQRRALVGPRAWSAMWQQNPVPAEGSLFQREWWRYWQALPPLEEKWLSVDCAFKDLKTSDFVVVQAWGRWRDQYYLLGQERRRLDFIGTQEAIKSMAGRWSPGLVWVEDKANGPAIIKALRKEIAGVMPFNPKDSKEARAAAISPLVKEGRVFIPRPVDSPWVEAFMSECEGFPGSDFKDQVDALSQGLYRFAGTAARPAEETKEKEPRGRRPIDEEDIPKDLRDPHFGAGLDDARMWGPHVAA